MVCHCWYFDYGFKFQNFVCNDCYDLTMICLNLADIRDLAKSRRPYLGLLKMSFFSNNLLMLLLILLLLRKSSTTALLPRRENMQTWLLFMKHDQSD